MCVCVFWGVFFWGGEEGLGGGGSLFLLFFKPGLYCSSCTMMSLCNLRPCFPKLLANDQRVEGCKRQFNVKIYISLSVVRVLATA